MLFGCFLCGFHSEMMFFLPLFEDLACVVWALVSWNGFRLPRGVGREYVRRWVCISLFFFRVPRAMLGWLKKVR